MKTDLSPSNISKRSEESNELRKNGLDHPERSTDYSTLSQSPDSLSDNDYSDTSQDYNPYKLITRRIDTMKIRNNQKKELEVTTSSTLELDITKDIAFRSGAIIYTRDKDQIYFCLGIDTQSGNLTDFGGGVKKGESVVEGGLRELHEESLNIFGDIKSADILDTTTFHCFNMAIMFIPLDVDRDAITEQFKSLVRDKEEPEVCDIVWLTKDELLESIHGRGKKLYIRVRRLLNKVTNAINDII